MNAKWVRRAVDVALVLIALAALAFLVRSGNAIAGGKFDMLTHAASSENIRAEVLGSPAAYWDLKEGSIRVTGQTAMNAVKHGARLALLGLLAAVFWTLRGLFARIGGGEVFTEANIAALRRIGWLFLAGAAISVVVTIAVQWVILDAIPPLDGRAIHASLSWSVKGVENIWMEYDPPIDSLLLAMLAFVTAGAFRSGKTYREDSESVV